MRFLWLNDKDICGPGRDPEDLPTANRDWRTARQGPREGHQEISWIWCVSGIQDSNPPSDTDSEEFVAGVRVEWMKAKACVDHWAEEKDLLQEQMRRVLKFFEWKSAWWLEQRHRCNNEHATVLSGLAAYAEKQATIYCRLAAKFAGMWLPFLESRGIYPNWRSR